MLYETGSEEQKNNLFQAELDRAWKQFNLEHTSQKKTGINTFLDSLYSWRITKTNQ